MEDLFGNKIEIDTNILTHSEKIEKAIKDFQKNEKLNKKNGKNGKKQTSIYG